MIINVDIFSRYTAIVRKIRFYKQKLMTIMFADIAKDFINNLKALR